MMTKKAATEMWWIIVGAVIALVVMIILLVLFTGRSNQLEQGLLDCQSKGGSCNYQLAEDCRRDGGTPSKAFDCREDSIRPCCFGLKEEKKEE